MQFANTGVLSLPRFQTEELYQVIEGQNGTMAKLREMLHQSQLGQLHVREGPRVAGRAGAPWVAQFSQALRTFPPRDCD